MIEVKAVSIEEQRVGEEGALAAIFAYRAQRVDLKYQGKRITPNGTEVHEVVPAEPLGGPMGLQVFEIRITPIPSPASALVARAEVVINGGFQIPLTVFESNFGDGYFARPSTFRVGTDSSTQNVRRVRCTLEAVDNALNTLAARAAAVVLQTENKPTAKPAKPTNKQADKPPLPF